MCVKAALQHLGVPVGDPRLPLLRLDDARRASLTALLDSLGELVALPQPTATPAAAGA